MPNSISTLGQSLSQIQRIKDQQTSLVDLQNQLATGKKTQKFSGLGSQGLVSQRARSDLSAIKVYNNNIDIADRRITSMVDTIGEFKAQARNMTEVIDGQMQEGEPNLDLLNDMAKNLLPFLEDLVNTQDNGRYVFSGAATDSKPLDLSGGTMESFMRNQLADWQNDSSPSSPSSNQLTGAYREITDSVMGYSLELSDNKIGKNTVRADKNMEVDYTMPGNNSGFKDVISSVKFLQELTSSDSSNPYSLDKVKLTEEDYKGATSPADLPKTPPPNSGSQIFLDNGVPPAAELNFDDPAVKEQLKAENKARADNFYHLINDISRTLNDGMKQLDHNVQALEGDRIRLNNIQESHKYDMKNLEDTISNVEDVDLNDVAVKLNFQKIQLEASFRVTSSLSNLNLSNFL